MRNWMMCIGLALALAMPGAVRAQEESQGGRSIADDSLEDLYGDEAFVSIATGSRKPIYKAPAVATVITAEEI
jgi:iron complex outermembrane receptor protein